MALDGGKYEEMDNILIQYGLHAFLPDDWRQYWIAQLGQNVGEHTSCCGVLVCFLFNPAQKERRGKIMRKQKAPKTVDADCTFILIGGILTEMPPHIAKCWRPDNT